MQESPKKLIEFHDPEFGIIYMEVPTDLATAKGWENISNDSDSGFAARIEGRLSDILGSLQRFAKGAINVLREMKPDEIEIKSGVKFTVKEGKLIGLLAQAEAEFPVEITIKWKMSNTSDPK